MRGHKKRVDGVDSKQIVISKLGCATQLAQIKESLDNCWSLFIKTL